jgi:polar amino acid transport system ATP-binding protein
MALVEIKNLHKSFGSNHVLRGIDFTVEQGEVVCVIGPSGSGKSTLLRCVNLLEQPQEGQVIVRGEDISDPDCHLDAARQQIGWCSSSSTCSRICPCWATAPSPSGPC